MHSLDDTIDLAIFGCLTLAGMLEMPMFLIALGAGLIAAPPIARFHAIAAGRSNVKTRQIVRSISIDMFLVSTAAAVAAYLVGLIVVRFFL